MAIGDPRQVSEFLPFLTAIGYFSGHEGQPYWGSGAERVDRPGSTWLAMPPFIRSSDSPAAVTSYSAELERDARLTGFPVVLDKPFHNQLIMKVVSEMIDALRTD